MPPKRPSSAAPKRAPSAGSTPTRTPTTQGRGTPSSGTSPSPSRVASGVKRRPGYSGALDAEGRPHGFGSQRYGDGSSYEGEWSRGVIHGEGIFRYASGPTYVGSFDHGVRSGHGRYTFACGAVYEGEYEADKRHGRGTMTFSENAGLAVRHARLEVTGPPAQSQSAAVRQTRVAKRFTGDFVAGKMHGNGTLEFVDGATYTGGFDNDVESGHGVLVFNGGATRLEADFRGGLPTGAGTIAHVRSGERVHVEFNFTGGVKQQLCAEKGNGAPCTFPQGGGDTCEVCGSHRRAGASDWLLPPEEAPKPQPSPQPELTTVPSTASAPSPATSAPIRPKSAAPKRPEQQPPAKPAFNDSTTESCSVRSESDDGDDAPKPTQQPAPQPLPTPEKPPAPGKEHATREALEELAASINALLRQARPGLGMAIADCQHAALKPDGTPSRETLAGTSYDVRVTQVAPASPASGLGIARGDYVLSVNGHAIRCKADFVALALTEGDTVHLEFRRRHPMANLAQTPGATPSPQRARGELQSADVVVGCTLARGDKQRLLETRDRVAAALAAQVAPVLAAECVAWAAEVAKIPVHPHPVAWGTAGHSATPPSGTPRARSESPVEV